MTYTEKYLELANEQAKFDHESAKIVNDGLATTLHSEYLVKLLPAEKIKITVTKPVFSDDPERDPITGAAKYDTEDVVETVDNAIVEAVIMSLPTHPNNGTVQDYVLGEHVLVVRKAANQFYNKTNKELYTVGPYNIIGRIKPNHVESLPEYVDESTGTTTNDILKAKK